MARAILLMSSSSSHRPFAGRSLGDHLAAVCAEAGLTAEAAAPDARLAAGAPVVLIDGRFAALSSASLGDLLRRGGGLLASHGAILAVALPGLDPERTLEEQLGDVATAAIAGAEEGLEDLSAAERAVRRRRVRDLAASGVVFVDPDRVVVDATVRIAPGVEIWPDVVLRGRTSIAAGAVVQSGCWVEDTDVGEQALLKPYTVCTQARIGPGCQVGPFAHLRPAAVLERGARVGNFVEVKKSVLREGAKANHLTYLGDAEVGAGANVGAGTITCNYDGFGKHRTTIGAGAFIGSNSSLVAPVVVGDGAIVGAGSVVVRDVPADALYLERAEPAVLEGKATAIRARARERKARG